MAAATAVLSREDIKKLIRKTPDPLADAGSHAKISCKEVYSVGEPDANGQYEVNYVNYDNEAMTVYICGRSVSAPCEGW